MSSVYFHWPASSLAPEFSVPGEYRNEQLAGENMALPVSAESEGSKPHTFISCAISICTFARSTNIRNR